MAIQTVDNKYGVAKWIVDPVLGRGTHTTISAAITSASSGETIFIRPGTFTENPILKAGVNLSTFISDALTPNVTIVGKCTMTTAGTVTISGIRLQTNGDNFLAISGSAASIVNLENCYLNASNATGMALSSSGGSVVNMFYCQGTIGAVGIKFFDISNDGSGFIMNWCRITNSGPSVTSSTASGGSFTMLYSEFDGPITTSGANTGFTILYCFMGTTNTATITHGSTSGTPSSIKFSFISAGSASVASISAGASLAIQDCNLTSSNTDVVTGAGTLLYGNISFSGTSSVMNTTTQTVMYSNLGKYKASGQPCFMAYNNTATTNNTGDGTAYTLIFGTERFDQNSNFDGTSTFTAPVTGKYLFNCSVLFQGTIAASTLDLKLVTTAQTYTFGNTAGSIAGNAPLGFSVIADMTAADTATVVATAGGGAKTVGIYGGAGDPRTMFSGQLVA